MYEELVEQLRTCGNSLSCNKCKWSPDCGGTGDVLRKATNAIEKLSKERKTGKWIYDSEPYPLGNPYGHYGCDQCGESVPARTNFCPNCGAKMEVPTDV